MYNFDAAFTHYGPTMSYNVSPLQHLDLKICKNSRKQLSLRTFDENYFVCYKKLVDKKNL